MEAAELDEELEDEDTGGASSLSNNSALNLSLAMEFLACTPHTSTWCFHIKGHTHTHTYNVESW